MYRKLLASSRFVSASAAVLAFAATIMTASAHHGWSGYQESPVTLKGSIKEVDYVNPHGSISLEADGKTWHVVLAPLSRMLTRGLSKEMLTVGLEVTVEGYPHMKSSDELRAERIIVSGKTIELR